MRTRICWLMGVLLIVFMGFGSSRAQENMLVNGGFEDGVMAPWTIIGNAAPATRTIVTGDAIEGESCLNVVATQGAQFWSSYTGAPGARDVVFEEGETYTFSGFFKCSTSTDTLIVNMKLETNAGNLAVQKTITSEWQEYYITRTFTSDGTGCVVIHHAFADGEFWVDDLKVYKGEYVPTE